MARWVSLDAARRSAQTIRDLIREGVDPIDQSRAHPVETAQSARHKHLREGFRDQYARVREVVPV